MKTNKGGLAQLVAVSENLTNVSEAATLRPDQSVVKVTSSDAAYAVTLPSVGAAAGMPFYIYAAAIAYGYNVTIQDQNESRGWKNVILNHSGQSVVLVSDGEKWEVVGGTADTTQGRLRETFSGNTQSSGRAGTIATGVAGSENVLQTADGNALEYHILGTQTILAPSFNGYGLDIGMDQTANDGCEITPGIAAVSKFAYTVGAGAFFFRAQFTIEDVTGSDDCAVGFRKAEAYQAAIDDYDELAALNVISGAISIETILNGAATTTTNTTDAWADAETHELEVRVDAAGAVTYLIDGVAPTVTAAFSLDAGEVVIPFIYFLHDTDLAGAVVFTDLEAGYL